MIHNHDLICMLIMNHSSNEEASMRTYRVIQLNNRKGKCFVDECFYERLKAVYWALIDNYAGRRNDGVIIFMHELIIKTFLGLRDCEIHHHDGNYLNNCVSNLVIMTYFPNGTVLKGIGYNHKRNKWLYTNMLHDRINHHSYHDTVEQAIQERGII